LTTKIYKDKLAKTFHDMMASLFLPASIEFAVLAASPASAASATLAVSAASTASAMSASAASAA
jgi:putative effector of murein hydrolase LrgA (UPF0299 family)